MATIETVSSVRIEDHSSMTGVAGSTGYAAAAFETDIYIWVVIDSDGGTWIAPHGGRVYYNGGDLSYVSPTWDLNLYFHTQAFTAVAQQTSITFTPTGVTHVYQGDNIIQLSGPAGSANANGPLANYPQPVVGANTSTLTGFKQVTPIDQWQKSASGDTYYGYLLGWVSTNYVSDTEQEKTMVSVRFSITQASNPELFIYFPWERRIDNIWYSLNRQGPTSTNAGLFRMINGSWSPCTNTPSTTSANNHGFRYNNGWQRSPKSGQGA